LKILLTGGSGFIGQRFLRALAGTHRAPVYCLSRSEPEMDPAIVQRDDMRLVIADLLDAARYAPVLSECDTVVHLAGLTGKAAPAEYFRINTEGTQVLLEASRRAGVRRFLYVSSIAARFAAASHYYYAESKRRAEEAVHASGLAFTIVRPTIVVGKGGGPWENLARLTALPLLPVLGNGTRIQPIYVDDCVAALRALVDRPSFRNETVELGGPEITTFGWLLCEAARLRHGRRPWTVTVPVKPLVRLLALLEGFARSRLPLSAGQLAAFLNDSTVRLAPAWETALPPMRTVSEMLKLVSDNG